MQCLEVGKYTICRPLQVEYYDRDWITMERWLPPYVQNGWSDVHT